MVAPDATAGGWKQRSFRVAWAGGSVLLALYVSLAPGRAYGSQLQLPHAGGRDGALSGNVVAAPIDGVSTLFFNPAGVVGPPSREAQAGIQLANLRGRYRNDALGYREKSDENPIAPTLWIGSDAPAPWHVGVGLYGAVGSAYQFPSDSASGVTTRFLGELGIVHLGFVAGRQLAPGLRVGVQVAPSFGKLKGGTPSPLGDVRFDLEGLGIVGSMGLLYDIHERTTLGIAYRSPGVVFLRGDGKVGGAPERVKINLRIPQSLTFGIAQQLTDRMMLTLQVSWVHYPDFERREFKFARNPVLDQRFIEDARAVFRYGAGIEYALSDWLSLRCGFSYEPWMIEDSAMRPTLYDVSDLMFMAGIGLRRGRWLVDLQSGIVDMKNRTVRPSDQPTFPGRYELDSPWGFGLSITYQFHPS